MELFQEQLHLLILNQAFIILLHHARNVPIFDLNLIKRKKYHSVIQNC